MDTHTVITPCISEDVVCTEIGHDPVPKSDEVKTESKEEVDSEKDTSGSM